MQRQRYDRRTWDVLRRGRPSRRLTPDERRYILRCRDEEGMSFEDFIATEAGDAIWRSLGFFGERGGGMAYWHSVGRTSERWRESQRRRKDGKRWKTTPAVREAILCLHEDGGRLVWGPHQQAAPGSIAAIVAEELGVRLSENTICNIIAAGSMVPRRRIHPYVSAAVALDILRWLALGNHPLSAWRYGWAGTFDREPSITTHQKRKIIRGLVEGSWYPDEDYPAHASARPGARRTLEERTGRRRRVSHAKQED